MCRVANSSETKKRLKSKQNMQVQTFRECSYWQQSCWRRASRVGDGNGGDSKALISSNHWLYMNISLVSRQQTPSLVLISSCAVCSFVSMYQKKKKKFLLLKWHQSHSLLHQFISFCSKIGKNFNIFQEENLDQIFLKYNLEWAVWFGSD